MSHSSNFCLHSLAKIDFKFSPCSLFLLLQIKFDINFKYKSLHNVEYKFIYVFSFIALSTMSSTNSN